MLLIFYFDESSDAFPNDAIDRPKRNEKTSKIHQSMNSCACFHHCKNTEEA